MSPLSLCIIIQYIRMEEGNFSFQKKNLKNLEGGGVVLILMMVMYHPPKFINFLIDLKTSFCRKLVKVADSDYDLKNINQ